MAKQLKYNDAIEELEEIIFNVENSSPTDIDTYTKKAKRAKELIVFCTKKLHIIDAELEDLLSD